MTALVWDSRNYEVGIDRGVLFLSTGVGVAWSGLTGVTEAFGQEKATVYFDGRKINELVYNGEFSATLQALSRPREFEQLQGLAAVRPGMFLANQPPQLFDLSYRTLMGDFYKLHLLYNLTAKSKDLGYGTVDASPSPIGFEWTISAVPEEVDGFRPVPQVVVDSRTVDPAILTALENQLYGTAVTAPAMPDMADLVTLLTS